MEDRDHIVWCQHDNRRKWRENLLTGLLEKCTKLETAPGVEEGLVGDWPSGLIGKNGHKTTSSKALTQKKPICARVAAAFQWQDA